MEDKLSSVGDGISANRGNWSFSGEVVKTFDDHVSKSVPMYAEGHKLICDLSDFFIKNNSNVYEIGCSTGTLIIKLAEHNADKKGVNYVGVDIENDMILAGMEKLSNFKNLDSNIEFVADDIFKVELKKADLIICYYTIQFIEPSLRQGLIDIIYEKLNWGGALIMFEKVRGSDARFQDIMSSAYVEYKIRMGYSFEDIIAKSRSLKGVLEPFSTQANIDMLKRAGFIDINTIQKYICFEGFMAIK